jgi:hypothetical protein
MKERYGDTPPTAHANAEDNKGRNLGVEFVVL